MNIILKSLFIFSLFSNMIFAFTVRGWVVDENFRGIDNVLVEVLWVNTKNNKTVRLTTVQSSNTGGVGMFQFSGGHIAGNLRIRFEHPLYDQKIYILKETQFLKRSN